MKRNYKKLGKKLSGNSERFGKALRTAFEIKLQNILKESFEEFSSKTSKKNSEIKLQKNFGIITSEYSEIKLK